MTPALRIEPATVPILQLESMRSNNQALRKFYTTYLFVGTLIWGCACGCLPSKVTVATEIAPKITRRAGEDWPAFLGPRGDSKSRERGMTSPWPAAGPRIVWHRQLGGGYGMPSIAGGRLFQFERIGDEATLTVLESETGRFLWKFTYPTDFEDLYGYDNGPRTSPVIDKDRVYLFGAEGMLHCLSIDGTELWKVDTQAKFNVVQNFFGVGSTPIVEGDLLIVHVGGSPPEDLLKPPGQLDLISGNGSGVVAFDKLTGKVRYQFSDELASYAGPTAATIDDRRWCFVFARGGLIGFDPTSGKQDFFFPWRARILESVNAANPVVIGDQVFISECYGPGSALVRVQPGKCDKVWSDADRPRNKSLQLHWNTPIYLDGYLYGSSGRHEGNAELRCIDAATGEVMWSEPGLRRASLLYVDNHLVCLSEDGVLRLLKVNPKKYDLVSECVLVDTDGKKAGLGLGDQRLLKPPAWAAPIVSHGLLYVRGRDRLVCLELIPAENITLEP